MDVDFFFECDMCKKEVATNLYDQKTGVCTICLCENSFQNMYIDGTRLILSIDIGIKHLALVLSSVSENYDFENIVWFDLVDITEFHCKPNCPFLHTKTFADWIRHFIDNYEYVLNKAERILIERQPPQGLVVVEQLLFGCFREKSVLIAPNSVHKFFNIGDYDYDQRKVAAFNLTHNYFKGEFYDKLNKYDRNHDICDAVLFTIFWIRKEKEKIEKELLLVKRKEAMQKHNKHLGMSIDDFFDIYRYIPK
jgi:hypothetical protein